MSNPTSWRPTLEARLGAERLIDLVEGPFVDKPKSMRVGLLGVTEKRIVFYRKKLFGEEFVSLDFALVRSAETESDDFSVLLAEGGADALSLVINRTDGSSLRMKALTSEEAERVAAVVSSHLGPQSNATG